MSLAMRQARFAQGDPGLFGSIFKGITGAVGGFLTGGPAGAVIGAASSVLGKKSIAQAKATTLMSPTHTAILTRTASPPMFPQAPGGAPFSGVSIGPGGVQIGTARQLAPAPQAGTTGALVGKGAGTPCQSGYHYNKSRYYSTRYGVVEKGSVCVKNRRRNPLNPRALSRAMSRVKSAQKAVRCLQLFAGPAARASAKANGRGRGRGCGGRCKTK